MLLVGHNKLRPADKRAGAYSGMTLSVSELSFIELAVSLLGSVCSVLQPIISVEERLAYNAVYA